MVNGERCETRLVAEREVGSRARGPIIRGFVASIAPRVRLAGVKCFFSVCSYDYGVRFGTNGNVRSSFSSKKESKSNII